MWQELIPKATRKSWFLGNPCPHQKKSLMSFREVEENRVKRSARAGDGMAAIQIRIYTVPKGLWNICGSEISLDVITDISFDSWMRGD